MVKKRLTSHLGPYHQHVHPGYSQMRDLNGLRSLRMQQLRWLHLFGCFSGVCFTL